MDEVSLPGINERGLNILKNAMELRNFSSSIKYSYRYYRVSFSVPYFLTAKRKLYVLKREMFSKIFMAPTNAE